MKLLLLGVLYSAENLLQNLKRRSVSLFFFFLIVARVFAPIVENF